MKKISLLLILLSFVLITKALCFNSEDITGFWLTFDKNTKEPKSQIEIYKNNDGKYYGKIVWLKEPIRNNQPAKDKNNPDEKLRDRPLLGLQIISGFEFDGDEWGSGKIYDPESGKTYKCKAWFEDNNNKKLFVRGYIGFSLIGRNVEWARESKKR